MECFKKLILLGRPASGKSEFIDFMKKLDAPRRLASFHIGNMVELDDFLWLWEKFTEDDLWEKAGKERLFSAKNSDGYLVANGAILDFCFAKFNSEVLKQPEGGTIFIEFSRGAGDGGYRHALSLLSDAVLKEAAILFIHTSYEESCRRNEARYREKLKHSVLAHKVPPKDMERFGKEIDWLELTGEKSSGRLQISGLKIPFVTMNNEPELKDFESLFRRYKTALDQLKEETCRLS